MGKIIISRIIKPQEWNYVLPSLSGTLYQVVLGLPQDYLVVSAYRSRNDQAAIYAKGRTVMSDINCSCGKKPGTCKKHPLGAIVTNAKPGQTPHNFGLAVDLCPMAPHSMQAQWDNEPAFKALADAAVKAGLRAGYYFRTIHDSPHIEDSTWDLANVKAIDADFLKRNNVKA